MSTVDKTEHGEHEQEGSGGLLKKAARAIGSAVGTAAAKTGIAHAQPEQSTRHPAGKLQPTHKHRLPRKLKKHQKKTQQAAGLSKTGSPQT